MMELDDQDVPVSRSDASSAAEPPKKKKKKRVKVKKLAEKKTASQDKPARADKSAADAKAAAPGKSRVKFESVMPREEAVAYLQAVVEGLRKGAIKFRQGSDTVALTPSQHVEIAVKARRKDKKESVTFEMSWQTAEEPEITISSD